VEKKNNVVAMIDMVFWDINPSILEKALFSADLLPAYHQH
jgi:hypothetical protein